MSDKLREAAQAAMDALFSDDPRTRVRAVLNLYVAPPSREWVGLTDEEVNSIYEAIEKVVGDHWENGGTKLMFPITLYEAFEAKLREKNGG